MKSRFPYIFWISSLYFRSENSNWLKSQTMNICYQEYYMTTLLRAFRDQRKVCFISSGKFMELN